MNEGMCSIEGCEHGGRIITGWCFMHYMRNRRYGDPLLGSKGVIGPRQVRLYGVTAEERFWHHVRRHDDDCWEWIGDTDHYGYGAFSIEGQGVKAHRFSWSLAHPGEPLPPVVRHACDNPPCTRFDHLIAGTQVENLRDMKERGRARKVSDAQIASMRAEYAAGGVLQRELASKYGIGVAYVNGVLNHKIR